MSTREPLEAFREALARVELMASGDPQWDLSKSDRRALKITLQALAASAEPPAPSDDDDETLRPCPFCGGTPEMRHIDEGENAGADFIECIQCQASTNLQFSLKDDGRPALRERWNRRAQPAPQSVEELRALPQKFRDAAMNCDAHGYGHTWNCRCYKAYRECAEQVEAALARITPKEKP